MEGKAEIAKNPLLNELVIEHLFKYLNINDLTICRLICKLWNYEANLLLKTRKLIDFSGGNAKNIYTFLRLVKYYEDLQSNEEEDNTNTNISSPFGHFSLLLWDSDEPYRSRFISLPNYTEKFMEQFGQYYIKELQLSFNDFIDTMVKTKFRDWFIRNLKQNLVILSLNGMSSYIHKRNNNNELYIFNGPGEPEMHQILPNLRILILTDFFDEEADQSGIEVIEGQEQDPLLANNERFGTRQQRFSARFISDLFKMVPNLEELVINTYDNKNCSLTSTTLLDGLQVIKKSPYFRKLTLKTYINDLQLKTINSYEFQLVSCEIKYLQLSNSSVVKNVFEKFLASQAESLKCFTIGISGRNSNQPFQLKFPRIMKRLESLTIVGPTLNIDDLAVEFDYSEASGNYYNLPKLQKLALQNYVSFTITTGKVQLEKLESQSLVSCLELPTGFQDEKAFEIILTTWKHLRSLKLTKSPCSLLQILWNFGTDIEELEIYTEESDIESCLTGLPAIIDKVEQEMDKTKTDDGDGTNGYETSDNGPSAKLGLTSLKKLRKLVLSGLAEDEVQKLNITDVFITITIPKLQYLISLVIKNSKISELGLMGLRFFEAKHEFLHLDIS